MKIWRGIFVRLKIIFWIFFRFFPSLRLPIQIWPVFYNNRANWAKLYCIIKKLSALHQHSPTLIQIWATLWKKWAIFKERYSVTHALFKLIQLSPMLIAIWHRYIRFFLVFFLTVGSSLTHKVFLTVSALEKV